MHCKNEVAVYQFDKHFNSEQCNKGKSGKYLKKTLNLTCIFCEKISVNTNSAAQHSIRCNFNPNKIKIKGGMSGKVSHKKGKTKYTEPSLMKQSETLKARIKSGEIKTTGRPHSQETKEKLSIIMSERIKRNIRFSKMENYKGIWLESSYESIVARELDKNDIKWERPSALKWSYNDRIRRYLPDFYLPDFNVYLDPKNDYLIKKDKLKIELTSLQNNVTIIVLNKEELQWEKIKKKIECSSALVCGAAL